eukprot:TRINITY_DN3574_c0_g1_i3.p1 TRINITY_DN3574_c0_g1~~TRINITY_DN3574_c0_g1_i3.p1  ORF type:complete len:207 (+),score=34.75 TRINITY_DN3574_c0_g1_i3:52-621(+)
MCIRDSNSVWGCKIWLFIASVLWMAASSLLLLLWRNHIHGLAFKLRDGSNDSAYRRASVTGISRHTEICVDGDYEDKQRALSPRQFTMVHLVCVEVAFAVQNMILATVSKNHLHIDHVHPGLVWTGLTCLFVFSTLGGLVVLYALSIYHSVLWGHNKVLQMFLRFFMLTLTIFQGATCVLLSQAIILQP